MSDEKPPANLPESGKLRVKKDAASPAAAAAAAGKKPRKRKVLRRVLLAVLAVVVVALVGTTVFMMIPLQATDEARSVMTSSDQTVFLPEGAQADDDFEYGLVFYPGAKVEPAAYAPLLQTLADKGWLVVAVDAPAHFMMLNIDAAAGPLSRYPNVQHWYVGGHSLGGVCASRFAASHTNQVAGVVLLASGPDVDLSATSLDVVSVRGSNDGVFTESDLMSFASNLPSTTRMLTIKGGNHAQFGNYGFQSGDNAATISSAEQQQATVDFIVSGLPD